MLGTSPKGLADFCATSEKGLAGVELLREGGLEADADFARGAPAAPKGLGDGEDVDVARVAGADRDGGAPKGLAAAGLLARRGLPALPAGGAPKGDASNGDAVLGFAEVGAGAGAAGWVSEVRGGR